MCLLIGGAPALMIAELPVMGEQNRVSFLIDTRVAILGSHQI
jgi:hypothetical protein